MIDGDGAAAPPLLEIATTGGAASLGLECGAIEPGLWADLVAIDLDHPSLADVDPQVLGPALVFGAGDVVNATCVGGRWQDHRSR